METTMDVDYFLRKFSAIPEEMWLIGSQGERDIYGDKPHCALGWCRNENMIYGNALAHSVNGNPNMEDGALAKLFLDAGIFGYYNSTMQGVAMVNNGDHPKYQQPTPKARILAALHDIKAMQEPKKEEPKVIYKVVEVDSKVKQLVKEERILN